MLTTGGHARDFLRGDKRRSPFVARRNRRTLWALRGVLLCLQLPLRADVVDLGGDHRPQHADRRGLRRHALAEDRLGGPQGVGGAVGRADDRPLVDRPAAHGAFGLEEGRGVCRRRAGSEERPRELRAPTAPLLGDRGRLGAHHIVDVVGLICPHTLRPVRDVSHLQLGRLCEFGLHQLGGQTWLRGLVGGRELQHLVRLDLVAAFGGEQGFGQVGRAAAGPCMRRGFSARRHRLHILHGGRWESAAVPLHRHMVRPEQREPPGHKLRPGLYEQRVVQPFRPALLVVRGQCVVRPTPAVPFHEDDERTLDGRALHRDPHEGDRPRRRYRPRLVGAQLRLPSEMLRQVRRRHRATAHSHLRIRRRHCWHPPVHIPRAPVRRALVAAELAQSLVRGARRLQGRRARLRARRTGAGAAQALRPRRRAPRGEPQLRLRPLLRARPPRGDRDHVGRAVVGGAHGLEQDDVHPPQRFSQRHRDHPRCPHLVHVCRLGA
mmetsp:Transcript_8643/g.24918  ORF Transcript_8643/g.24918 Transcript_8643/m.24918 type:complete len:492 (+) Transcript_8643:700-2175(+)